MASVTIEMSGNEAKLWRSLQKIEQKNKSLNESFKKVGRGARTAGKQAQLSFGSKALGAMTSYAAGMVGIGAAVGVVTRAFTSMKEANDRAIASMIELKDTERALSQIAKTPAELRGDIKRADRLAAAFGIGRAEAQKLIFGAKSAGFEEDIPLFAKAIGSNLISGKAVDTIAGKTPGLFNDMISASESVNAVLKASQKSVVNVDQITRGLSQAAGGGGVIDADPAEIIAALGVLTEKFKSPEQTGIRIQNLASQFKVKKLEGFEDLGFLDKIQKLSESPDALKEDFFGTNKELIIGFDRFMGEMATIREETKGVRQAIDDTGTDRSPVRFGISVNEEVFASRIAIRKAEAQARIAEQDRLATAGGARRVAASTTMARIDDANVGMIGRAYAEFAVGLNETLGRKPDDIRALAWQGAIVGGAMQGDFGVYSRLKEADEKAKAAIETTREAAEILKEAGKQLSRDVRRTTTGNTAAARQRAAMNPVATE